jgi:hypothetical protein
LGAVAVVEVDASPATEGAHRSVPVGAMAIVFVVALLGVARWTGQVPFGSDNDEYQLVARQLLHLDAPVVAGVEGTKYPLGYPAVLAAIDAVGLPVVDAALALNVVLVGVTAALTAVAARRLGVAAAVAAAGVVLVCRPLWAATQSTMPDVAFTAVVAAALAVTGRRRAPDVAVLTGLALAATALKSVGLLVGLAATAALLVAGGRRLLALLPAAGALVLSAATALLVGRHPEHTTGYARTFRLEDPYDAAAGDASVVDVVGRLPARIDLVLDDAARALWGDLVHGPPAWVLTIALLACGVVAARTVAARSFVAALLAAHAVALAVWPYSSVRFGLPLVPVAALGVAGIVARIRAPAPIVAGAVAALVVLAVPTFRDEAHREGELFAELDAARRDIAAWLPAGATPVSTDYRELATVLPYGTAVHPLSYTSDPGALLDEAREGTHLVVVRGLYGRREQVVATLLTAHPDRFELVHQTARIDVYAVG